MRGIVGHPESSGRIGPGEIRSKGRGNNPAKNGSYSRITWKPQTSSNCRFLFNKASGTPKKGVAF